MTFPPLGPLVQGHDAPRGQQPAPHGVLRRQTRPHRQGGEGDGLWQLQLRRRQQPGQGEGIRGRLG